MMKTLDSAQLRKSPLMVGISGYQLTQLEREYLSHALTGGVILFSRNYQNHQQLIALTQEIHTLKPSLMIAVDQEGGRVQRFRKGFTALPPAADIGQRYDRDPKAGLAMAKQTAITLATELQSVGIDLSFAPVLDLYDPNSQVIGDRAFHQEPTIVAKLASAFLAGFAKVNFPAVGKHYPGHGSVIADTHTRSVIDTRPLSVIEQNDLVPFEMAIKQGIAGIMSAHVIYPKIDNLPTSYSKIWLNKLRQDYGFTGIIFSDDLGMQAAKSQYGTLTDRTRRALSAGCDMVLLCNELEAIPAMLKELSPAYQGEK